MGYVVKMPKLGLEMERGTLLEWYVEEGAEIEEDEVLAEIESEKSIGEIEAREDGVLRLVDLEEGESVPPGTPIAIVAGADEDISELEDEFDTEEAESPVDVESGSEDAIETTAETEAASSAGPDASTDEVRASPRAERRAEELGVDLADIDGTGPQGAITADDVESAAEETPAEAVESAVEAAEPADVGPGRYRTATLVVGGDEADALIETTELAADAFDVEATPLDVLLVAVSAALADRPSFNATFEDETHHLHRRRDVAITTSSEGDRVRPVLDAIETRSFADLVSTRREATERAVASGVSDGHATFSLALEGEIDGNVEGIVAPPTVAGLVANPTRRRAVPAENGVALERTLSLSLAYDTRVLGDADAEAFLETLLERIGDAPELVLRTYGTGGKSE